MAMKANTKTQYYITEDAYVFCPTCGGKQYNLSRVGMRCNRGDLPPFVGGFCTGILTRSFVTNSQITSPDKTAAS